MNLEKRKEIGSKAIIVAVVLVLFLFSGVWYFQNQPQPQKYTGPIEKLNFSSSLGIKNAGIYIASSNGYFQEEGLDVNITEVPNAKLAFLRMLNGEGVDISAIADTPIAIAATDKNDFYILATISEGQDEKVIARKDKGINVIADLKGKKIGIAGKGIGNHFFFSTLLLYNELAEKDVEIIFIDADKLLSALENGTLDAIVVVEPDATNAIKLLGGNAVVFKNNNIYNKTFNLTVRKDFAQNHPGTLIRFLRAINKANKFISENKEESQTAIAKKLKLSNKEIAAIWGETSISLSLNQSILLTLEEESRWAIKNKLSDQIKIPNFLSYIYYNALEEVNPEAVTIIGKRE